MVLPDDVDLLNPQAELEKRKRKFKCFVQSPNSFFMDIKCQGCFNITTIFSHSQTVAVCANCQTVLCQPTRANKCESAFNEYATLCTPLHGIRRTIRDLRPAHYLFKVVSYSSLEVDKYESDVFQAGDYKWKLCLYPNGDTKRNGNGHVSLYLQIEDTDTLSRDWGVKVEFKLFVYDQINDKYLTIQGDGDGAIRRFHETKTQWGFPQLVPLDIFKDGTNGYLLDDYCVFGAEVFVLEHTDFKSHSLLPKAKALSRNTYTWKIEKFSTLKDKFYVSEVFTLFGIEWKLKVYPKGNGNSKVQSMSVYLQLDGISKDLEVTAGFILRLRDQVHNKHREMTEASHLFNLEESEDWGFTNLVTLKQLQDPSKGLLKNDTLIIEVQLLKLSLNIKDY